MKSLFIVFIAIYCADAAAAADIYKCVDKNGVVTYTDSGCGQNSSQTLVIHEEQQHRSKNKMTQPKPLAESRTDKRLEMTRKDIYNLAAVIYFVMSAVCLFLYRSDKKAASSGKWRKPESTLHFVELLGGWPGGLIAQRIYRHKTQKKSYQIAFWAIVSVHIAVWTDFIFLKSRIYLNFIKFVGNQLNRLT